MLDNQNNTSNQCAVNGACNIISRVLFLFWHEFYLFRFARAKKGGVRSMNVNFDDMDKLCNDFFIFQRIESAIIILILFVRKVFLLINLKLANACGRSIQ